MVLSQSLFTFLIIFGIVGGIGSLTTIVCLLIFEKERENLSLSKKKNELELLLKEAQLANLTANVQPHFLFNSLNTISLLVRLNKKDDAIHSIQLISSLLRYTLRDKEQLVTLEDELTSIKMYLSIQETRFGNRLSWNIDNFEKYQSIKIPILSLQTLVENACKHGIEPKIEGGKISITFSEDQNTIEIKIIDNGRGMPRQALAHFNHYKFTGTTSEILGIGLINTYERLKHFFGEVGDLIINSSEEGTVCSIVLSKGEVI